MYKIKKPAAIKFHLNKGRPVIALIKSFRKTRNNHFIVITGYDGKYIINDPQSKRRKPQKRLDIITKYEYCAYGVER